VTEQTGSPREYSRVDQPLFKPEECASFQELVENLQGAGDEDALLV
jgi:hypothetical protein